MDVDFMFLNILFKGFSGIFGWVTLGLLFLWLFFYIRKIYRDMIKMERRKNYKFPFVKRTIEVLGYIVCVSLILSIMNAGPRITVESPDIDYTEQYKQEHEIVVPEKGPTYEDRIKSFDEVMDETIPK